MPTVNITTDRNSTVDEVQPTTNFPASSLYFFSVGGANMTAGSLGGGINNGEHCRAWIGFNLATIPTNATIVSATLSFNSFATFGNYASIGINVKYCTDNSWTEGGVTWNNAPNGSVAGTATYVGVADSGGGGDCVGDVTANVTSALASRRISWRLDSDDADPAYGSNFASRTNNSIGVPSLSITYTLPATGAGALFFGSD